MIQLVCIKAICLLAWLTRHRLGGLELQNASQSIVMKSIGLVALVAFWRLELRNASQAIDLIMKSDSLKALAFLDALGYKLVHRASIR